MSVGMSVKIFASVYIFLSLFAVSAYAQDNMAKIKSVEDSLLVTADSMYYAFIPEERNIYNEKFVKQLLRALKYTGSYSYSFERLGNKINIITPDDKSFRIFNWAIAPTEVTRRYYGAVQMPGDQLKLFPLIDYTTEAGKGAEDSILR